MKNRKGLILVAAALLMMAVLVPVYALGDQSGIMQHDRDQDCTPQGPATRAYGEDPSVQSQEEKPEGPSQEETKTLIQEQTTTQQLSDRDCENEEHNCENEDCEQYQYQHQYQYLYHQGQEED